MGAQGCVDSAELCYYPLVGRERSCQPRRHGNCAERPGEYRRQRHDSTITSLRNEGLCANTACERQRERYYAGLAKAGLPG